MTTRTQMLADRATAGAAYATAAAAYLDAFVELHAYDLTLGGSVRLMTGGFPELQPPTPHSVFLTQRLDGSVGDRVAARIAQLGVPTGD